MIRKPPSQCTRVRQPQLSAYNSGISEVPAIIAHCSPHSTDADLHSAFSSWLSTKSNGTIRTSWCKILDRRKCIIKKAIQKTYHLLWNSVSHIFCSTCSVSVKLVSKTMILIWQLQMIEFNHGINSVNMNAIFLTTCRELKCNIASSLQHHTHFGTVCVHTAPRHHYYGSSSEDGGSCCCSQEELVHYQSSSGHLERLGHFHHQMYCCQCRDIQLKWRWTESKLMYMFWRTT